MLMPVGIGLEFVDLNLDINSQISRIEFRTAPDEDMFGYSSNISESIVGNGRPELEAGLGTRNWEFPPEGGKLVCVMQADKAGYGSHSGGELYMDMTVRKRHWNL